MSERTKPTNEQVQRRRLAVIAAPLAALALFAGLKATEEGPKQTAAAKAESAAIEAMEKGDEGYDVLSGSVVYHKGVNVRATPVRDNGGVESDDNIVFRVGEQGLSLYKPLKYEDSEGNTWYGALLPGEDKVSAENIGWINHTQVSAEDNSLVDIYYENPQNPGHVTENVRIEHGGFVSEDIGEISIAGMLVGDISLKERSLDYPDLNAPSR